MNHLFLNITKSKKTNLDFIELNINSTISVCWSKKMMLPVDKNQ